jgi:peptide subunit release factor 1 (eRF1)
VYSVWLLLLLLLQLPPNGLVVYTGMVMTEEGKEKKVRGQGAGVVFLEGEQPGVY